MWRSLADGISNASAWATEKINGESTTAEYYNPVNQEEFHQNNQFSNYDNQNDSENYTRPGFESRHVTEVRLDRAIDAGLNYTSKAIGSKIPDRIVSAVTGSGSMRNFSNNLTNSSNSSWNDHPNGLNYPRQKTNDLATDLSNEMKIHNNHNHNNANDNSEKHKIQNNNKINAMFSDNDLNNPKSYSNTSNTSNFNQNNNYPFQNQSNISKNPGELTFVFHETTTDTDERVSHDWTLDPRHSSDEICYTITKNEVILAERKQFPKLINLELFLLNSKSKLLFGDLLEFAANNQKSHWVVYLGDYMNNNIEMCIKYSKRLKEISILPLSSASKDRPVRRVNGVYTFIPKSIDMIRQAVEKIKNSSPQIKLKICNSFTSSEAFACWIRFQSDTFIKSSESINNTNYVLKIDYTPDIIDTLNFSKLNDCITKVRLLQKEGRTSIVNDRKNLLIF